MFRQFQKFLLQVRALRVRLCRYSLTPPIAGNSEEHTLSSKYTTFLCQIIHFEILTSSESAATATCNLVFVGIVLDGFSMSWLAILAELAS